MQHSFDAGRNTQRLSVYLAGGPTRKLKHDVFSPLEFPEKLDCRSGSAGRLYAMQLLLCPRDANGIAFDGASALPPVYLRSQPVQVGVARQFLAQLPAPLLPALELPSSQAQLPPALELGSANCQTGSHRDAGRCTPGRSGFPDHFASPSRYHGILSCSFSPANAVARCCCIPPCLDQGVGQT